MKNFLRQIAEQYIANESNNLTEYCFVLPNKRSGVFLAKHFSEIFAEHGKTAFLPRITTISDFITEFSHSIEASRTELLFILYNIYSDILTKNMSPKEIEDGKNLVDFNKFILWGDVLLNDFNDVDRDLVDAEQIFKNVKNLKEISANYLTEEQIEVIRRYWNEEQVPEFVKKFWNNTLSKKEIDKEEGLEEGHTKQTVAGFIKLWQVMKEIYDTFRKQLSNMGYSYNGMALRNTLERIKELNPEDFEYKRYIFVGFSTLSTAEEEIFSILKKYDLGDYYWDIASPIFKVEGNNGIEIIEKYVDEYPSLYPIMQNNENSEVHYPDFEIISFPTTMGQVKAIPSILREIHPNLFAEKEGGSRAKQDELFDTAIVLSDEAMLIPLLNSIPKEVEDVNVTMGFPLRVTQIASLLKNIISLQLRARLLHQEQTFFYDDVMSVLSHPIIRKIAGNDVISVVHEINERRLFNIPYNLMDKYDNLGPIFEMVENINDPDLVFDYLQRLFEWLIKALYQFYSDTLSDIQDKDYDRQEKVEKLKPMKLELSFVRSYIDALKELKRLYATHLLRNKVVLLDKSVFQLVERIAGNRNIAFEGKPLKGMQIMGVLETRALDFDNIIMPSMNERIFPRKHFSKSFIPNSLREGYHMSTIDDQERMYAYYFYRLMARAKRVFLLYDSRTSGIKSGDASRFITQLKYIVPNEKIHFHTVTYSIRSSEKRQLYAEKTKEVMDKLERYRNEENPRYLSASAFNEYINCPLAFYLKRIEYIPEEQEHIDYMDEGTYGNIIHEVVNNIYKDAQTSRGGEELPITGELLESFCNDALISRYLSKAIREKYLRETPEETPKELPGDAKIFHNLMLQSIKNMFRREKELLKDLNVSYVESENEKEIRLQYAPEKFLNFKYTIDRIDKVYINKDEYYYRLVDYKTGSDDTSLSKDINVLFKNTNKKAFTQLLLYSNAYAQTIGDLKVRIQPIIYSFRKMINNKIEPLTINKNALEDYREYNKEFLEEFDKVIDEIFDINIPFVAKPNEKSCKYCQFTDFCGGKKE